MCHSDVEATGFLPVTFSHFLVGSYVAALVFLRLAPAPSLRANELLKQQPNEGEMGLGLGEVSRGPLEEIFFRDQKEGGWFSSRGCCAVVVEVAWALYLALRPGNWSWRLRWVSAL